MKYFISFLLALSCGVATSFALANPASLNCTAKGGNLFIITGTSGSSGLCTFKDGSSCEEWAFYRGECGPKETLATTTPIVGGDRDVHGCIPSAGYAWNETSKTCERPWETATSSAVTSSPTFCGKKHAQGLGAKNSFVLEIQKILIEKGLLDSSFATGYFGSLTKKAVMAFQKQNNLPQTGNFGPLSMKMVCGK
jgi:hypothetical protein